MSGDRHTLGVGYLVGSGVTLTAVLLAAAVGSGGDPGVAPLLGAVPAVGLASAPIWLSRVRIDGIGVWRTAMWAALGVGVFAILDVGLLLVGSLWTPVSGATLAVVASSAGFGGVCGALVGCLIALNRRARALSERNAVMRRVLRHDLRTESNLILGHARAAADDTDGGACAHLDTIVESIERLLDRGQRIRRLQGSPATESAPIDPTTRSRATVAVVDEAIDLVRERSVGTSVDLLAPGNPEIRANEPLVRAVADVVAAVAGHVAGVTPVSVIVDDPSPTDRTVTIRIRRRDGGRVLSDADVAALGRGDETPLRHGHNTGLWAAKWCLERHGGRLVVTDGEVTLELQRVRAWGSLPAPLAATVPHRLR